MTTPLDSDRWKRAEALFERAVELPPEQRESFLRSDCADDPELLAEVRSLLEADESDDSFIEAPIRQAARQHAEAGPAVPLAGERIGPYEIVGMLGRGGMAEVYRAVRVDDEFRKEVAVKVLRSGWAGGDAMARFRRERQILADLEHPNIARLLDGGTRQDGTPYVVMELIDGVPIDRYADENRLDLDDRIALFRKVCAAVQFAHQQLIVHRDIKPANVLVQADGTPKLLDFGIAKFLEGEDGEPAAQTITSQSWMTPEYASPEQVRGDRITTASDVYSMGALLYELLTGVRPYKFESRRPAEIERIVCRDTPTRPSQALAEARVPAGTTTPSGIRRRRIAGDLDNIVLMALRKERDRRYRSAGELDDDLARFQQGLPVRSQPDTFGYRSAKFVQRHRAGVGLVSLLAVSLIGFGVTMAMQSQRLAQERDAVTAERDKARSVADFMVGLFKATDAGGAAAGDMTARELINQGAQRLHEDQLRDQPEIRAALLTSVGEVYRVIEEFDKAEALIEEGFRIRLDSFGRMHPDTADSFLAMGAMNYDRNEFEEALIHYGEAWEINKALFGERSIEAAESLWSIATVYEYTGEIHKAGEAYSTALVVAEDLLEEDDPEIFFYLRAHAGNLVSLGQRDEAIEIYKKILARQILIYGEDHLQVADTSLNLGVYIKNADRLDEAEPYYQRAIAIRERHIPGQVMTGQAHNNYGVFLRLKGEEAAAGQHMKRATEIYRSVLGRNTNTAQIQANYAAWLRDNGDPLQARRILEDSLAMYRESVLGEDYWVAGVARANYARTLLVLGDEVGAEREFAQAVEVLLDKRPTHFRAKNAFRDLAQFYRDRGRSQEAERLDRRARQRIEEFMND